jgi:hypothetical protein
MLVQKLKKFYWLNCGKQGHHEENCWLKEENKSKRSQRYKISNEMANSTLNNNYWNANVEYLLCALTIPTDSMFLLNPNIWITDTAASVHVTVDKSELQDEHKMTQAETITMV